MKIVCLLLLLIEDEQHVFVGMDDLLTFSLNNRIKIKHSILHLHIQFNEKIIIASIIIIFNKQKDHGKEEDGKEPFYLILDSNDIQVINIKEFKLNALNNISSKCPFKEQSNHGHIDPLHYQINQWYIKIWKPGINNPNAFPEAIEIIYKTKPNGLSLSWVQTQNQRYCNEQSLLQ